MSGNKQISEVLETYSYFLSLPFYTNHWTEACWKFADSFLPISTRQKQPPRAVLKKSCSENMHQIYRRTPMPKCDFNKDALQLYWNRTSIWNPYKVLLLILSKIKYENGLVEQWSNGLNVQWSSGWDASWSNGLKVKALDFQSTGPMFKTTGWLPGRLSLSSFKVDKISTRNFWELSKLPPQKGSSLEAVERHPYKGAIKFFLKRQFIKRYFSQTRI